MAPTSRLLILLAIALQSYLTLGLETDFNWSDSRNSLNIGSTSRKLGKRTGSGADWTSKTYKTQRFGGVGGEGTERMRLFFPPGAQITLDPMIKIPVINKDMLGIGSELKMSFPITIELDKITMKDWAYIKDHDWSLYSMSDIYPQSNQGWSGPSLDTLRTKRSIPGGNDTNEVTLDPPLRNTMNKGLRKASLCKKLALERLSVFKRLETLFDSYGYGHGGSGKACLLRAICEIHQFPLIKEYGLLGDLLTHFVSVSRLGGAERCEDSKESSILVEYLEAEGQGVKGSCQMHHKGCKNSLFVREVN